MTILLKFFVGLYLTYLVSGGGAEVVGGSITSPFGGWHEAMTPSLSRKLQSSA